LKEVTKGLSGKIFEIEDSNKQDESEKRSLNARVNVAKSGLERLDDLRASRLSYLQREHHDVYRAVMYLMKPEKDSRLIGKVHEPMILHACVNDLKYGGHLEKAIGLDNMTAVFVEHPDDLGTMLNIMKEQGIRISVFNFTPTPNFERPTNNVPDNLR
jgi:hypothetical protein